MFKKKQTPLAMDTVLGQYSSITGNIETEGSIKIMGKVEGDVRAGGDVYIESTSSITGDVFGSNVFVSGTIKGNIFAKGLLHLMMQARLYGDIEVGSIVTDEGAIFQGTCRMVEVPEEEKNENTGIETNLSSENNNVNNNINLNKKKNKLKHKR